MTIGARDQARPPTYGSAAPPSTLWDHADVRGTIVAGVVAMGNAAATFDLRPRADARSVVAERTASIPWYVWCLAAATAADLFGGYWDISWHISIGRDTLRTTAHMMIYLSGP